MTGDLLNILQEIRGTGGPGEIVNGMYYNIAIQPIQVGADRYSGMYGHIVYIYSQQTNIEDMYDSMTEKYNEVAITPINSHSGMYGDILAMHQDIIVLDEDITLKYNDFISKYNRINIDDMTIIADNVELIELLAANIDDVVTVSTDLNAGANSVLRHIFTELQTGGMLKTVYDDMTATYSNILNAKTNAEVASAGATESTESKNLAKEWAQNEQSIPVSTGEGFSAKHYSKLSQQEKIAAEQAALDAQHYRDELNALSASANSVPADNEATVSYTPAAGLLQFGIPKGKDGAQGIPGIGINLLGRETIDVIMAKLADAVGDSWVALDTGVDSNGDAVEVNDTLRAIDTASPTTYVNIGPVKGERGDNGTGWTSGAYNDTTGIVTFLSADGLGFTTNDLRGVSGVVNVGTTSTGLPGTDASVTAGGTPTNRILNFTIPQGLKGDPGLDGSNDVSTDAGNKIVMGSDNKVYVNGTLPTTGSSGQWLQYVSPTEGKWATLTVTSNMLEDVSVSTSKLQDLSVTTAKIANSAVTSPKLATNSITTVKITDKAVTSEKIADDTITNIQIAESTIGTTELANTSVTSDILADASVTAAKLADDAVTTTNIVDESVTGSKLANNTVDESKLADTSVTTNKLANEAVTTAKLAATSVTTAKLGSTSVTEAKLATDAVTVNKIKNNAVTNAKMGNNSVNHRVLGSDAVETGNIVDLNVTTSKLKDEAVTTAKIEDEAVTNSKLGYASVTEDKLASSVYDTLVQSEDSGAENRISSMVYISKNDYDAIAQEDIELNKFYLTEDGMYLGFTQMLTKPTRNDFEVILTGYGISSYYNVQTVGGTITKTVIVDSGGGTDTVKYSSPDPITALKIIDGNNYINKVEVRSAPYVTDIRDMCNGMTTALQLITWDGPFNVEYMDRAFKDVGSYYAIQYAVIDFPDLSYSRVKSAANAFSGAHFNSFPTDSISFPSCLDVSYLFHGTQFNNNCSLQGFSAPVATLGARIFSNTVNMTWLGDIDIPLVEDADSIFYDANDLIRIGNIDISSATSADDMLSSIAASTDIGDITAPLVIDVWSMLNHPNIASVGNLHIESAASVENLLKSRASLTTVGDIYLGGEALSAIDMVSSCAALKSVGDIYAPFTTNFQAVLAYSSTLTSVGTIHSSVGTVFTNMFKQSGIRWIGGIDTTNQTDTTDMFTAATRLENPTTTEQDAILAGTLYTNTTPRP